MLNRRDDSWKLAPALVFAPNSHVGIICGSRDSPGALPERAAVCRERLLAICRGDGQQGAGERGGF